jgi:hypothetical protein
MKCKDAYDAMTSFFDQIKQDLSLRTVLKMQKTMSNTVGSYLKSFMKKKFSNYMQTQGKKLPRLTEGSKTLPEIWMQES